MTDPLEHAKHLRTVHFSLLAAGFVILVTVVTAREGLYARAIKEAKAVEELSYAAGEIEDLLDGEISRVIKGGKSEATNAAILAFRNRRLADETKPPRGFVVAGAADRPNERFFVDQRLLQFSNGVDLNSRTEWSSAIGIFPETWELLGDAAESLRVQNGNLGWFVRVWEALGDLTRFDAITGLLPRARTILTDADSPEFSLKSEFVCDLLKTLSIDGNTKVVAGLRQAVDRLNVRNLPLPEPLEPMTLDERMERLGKKITQEIEDDETLAGVTPVEKVDIVHEPKDACDRAPKSGESKTYKCLGCGSPYAIRWTVKDWLRPFFVPVTSVELSIDGQGALIRRYDKPFSRTLDAFIPARGPFEEAFPALNAVRNDFSAMGVDNLDIVSNGNGKKSNLVEFLRLLQKRSGDRVDLFGVKAPGYVLTTWGGVVLTCIMLYLTMHLRAYVRNQAGADIETEFPWIGLYKEWPARLLTAASVVGFPFGLCLWLTWQVSRDGLSVQEQTYSILVTAANFCAAAFLATAIVDLWRKQDRRPSAGPTGHG